jgi:hypothetical protein
MRSPRPPLTKALALQIGGRATTLRVMPTMLPDPTAPPNGVLEYRFYTHRSRRREITPQPEERSLSQMNHELSI